MCNGFLLVDTFVTVGKCTNIYLQLTNQVDRNNFVLLFRIQSKYTLFVVKRQGTVGRIRHLAGCLVGVESLSVKQDEVFTAPTVRVRV